MIQVSTMIVQRGDSFTLHINHLSVEAGRILCVAGPNGCGKSTLLACLAGLVQPNYGSVVLAGKPVSSNLRSTKATIGYIPDDEAWLLPELCALEYLSLLEQVYRDAGVGHDLGTAWRELAQQLHFSALRQPLKSLSHGNKKKVQCIAGLMHRPTVILVDEIRNGLDPLVSKIIEQLLRLRVQQGACIVAATHDLPWAERMADEVLLLAHGKPIAHQPTQQLLRQHGNLERLFMTVASAP